MSCPWCFQRSIVFAVEKKTWDLFIFSCKCDLPGRAPWLKNRSYPSWQTALERNYIPEYVSPCPRIDQVHKVFELSQQDTIQFKSWVHHFGREKFVELFKSWREGKKLDDARTSDEASDLSMGRTPRGPDPDPRLQGGLAPGEKAISHQQGSLQDQGSSGPAGDMEGAASSDRSEGEQVREADPGADFFS